LGQHLAAGVVHRRQQVHRAAVAACSAGAAQRLAVHRNGPPPAGRWTLRLPVGQPGADHPGQGVGIQACERATDGRLGRDGEAAGGLLAGRRARREPAGGSAAHSAIAAIDRAPASTAAAARPRMVTNRWRRPPTARGSGMVAR
jgi:hypothetical protein